MENIINFYYNLYPENIYKMYGGFYFNITNNKYLLVNLIRPSKNILEIYEILMENRILNYLIILNKDNIPVSKDEEKEYILFQINCDDKKIIQFQEQLFIPYHSPNNWGKLWSERVDYYEIQINELAQDKKIILESIYYYIGLAENAIYIVNNTTVEEDSIYLQHYRMNVPVTKGEYFNPANIIGDVYVRDIAEYIKSSCFFEKKEDNFYLDYLNNIYFTKDTANLLLARLLYPSYYFDIFDEIILNNKEEEELLPIIHNCYKYENLILLIYTELEKKYPIININWIRKGIINQH